MADTSKYMSILAKVMRNKNASDAVENKEKYNRLYYKIHSDLNSQLQKSLYPFTSDIVQKCEDMMDAMEPLYICPEIIGKRCLLISNHKTTGIFEVYNQLFEDKEFSLFLAKIYTQIPLIIVNAKDENAIEILNYANVRINLTPSEFKFLVIESGKRKIALNKVIQYIFVKTKLSKEDICVISDNIYANAEKMFCRTLSQKVANIDTDGIKMIGKRHLDGFSALVMSNNVLSDMLNNPYIRKYHTITYNELDYYVNTDVRLVLYGFMDEFMSINTQIIDYYDEQQKQAKTTLQDVVGDIVRLGASGDQTLQSIRKFEESHEKKINSEAKAIATILKDIEELIVEICNDLGENYITGKQISRYVLDDIFESFFRSKNFSSGWGKTLLSRLYSFEYDNYDLVSTYAQNVAGKKVSFEAIEIEENEWEKAKMLLYILEPENIPEQRLRLYVDSLGDRCISGKELFAKALISSERIKKNLLQESFDKGYEKAGLMLLEKHKKGDKGVNLMSLANALIPEACMIVANQKMGYYQNRRRFVDLSDNEFAYYKIAAAKQYSPAIGKIVDVVFDSRFSSGFQIPKDDLDDEKYEEMIDNGHVICQLCQFLIGKMYQVDHYSEIQGIVLFSLNENLSSAMSLLTNAKSSLAYYCKGNMYEFGGGVAVDLNQAITNYQKAIKNGFEGRAEKRLAACNGKKSRYDYEQSSNEYYQSSRNYYSSSTRTGSTTVDDGCFAPGTHILMSNGMVKCVEHIEVGDKVLVFDHYHGVVCEETIIANVHDVSDKREYKIILLYFENNVSLSIVKSHALFDMTEKKYVLIDDSNYEKYIGHKFAFLKSNCIEEYELLKCSVRNEVTNFYMPLSRYHLNLFAESILTMPPTKLTVNLFSIKSNMQYDLSILEKIGKTSYEELKNTVSYEEYSVLPCEYLACVLQLNQCDFSDFEYVINLYRDQGKYLVG